MSDLVLGPVLIYSYSGIPSYSVQLSRVELMHSVQLSRVFEYTFNRGPKKFSLCLNSKGLEEKRKDGKGKTQ